MGWPFSEPEKSGDKDGSGKSVGDTLKDAAYGLAATASIFAAVHATDPKDTSASITRETTTDAAALIQDKASEAASAAINDATNTGGDPTTSQAK